MKRGCGGAWKPLKASAMVPPSISSWPNFLFTRHTVLFRHGLPSECRVASTNRSRDLCCAASAWRMTQARCQVPWGTWHSGCIDIADR